MQSNILIDEHYHVKLADFGLADLVRAHTTNAVALDDPTARWTAPEVYGLDSDSEVNPQGSEEGPTFAGDIYSFACVCVEVSGQIMASPVTFISVVPDLFERRTSIRWRQSELPWHQSQGRKCGYTRRSPSASCSADFR